jgi:hypothetical protein
LSSDIITEALLEGYRDTLKIIDTSVLLAALATVFLLMHGLNGEYRIAQQGVLERMWSSGFPVPFYIKEMPTERSLPPDSTARTNSPAMEIPILGFSTDVLSASYFVLALYFVLLVRASFYVHRLRSLKTSFTGAPWQNALSSYPSLVTAGLWPQVGICAALGVLGGLGTALVFEPVYKPAAALITSFCMLVVPGYLLLELRLPTA